MSAADFSIIEGVKENIQPLREGRNVAKLIEAIKEKEEVQHSESASKSINHLFTTFASHMSLMNDAPIYCF